MVERILADIVANLRDLTDAEDIAWDVKEGRSRLLNIMIEVVLH